MSVIEGETKDLPLVALLSGGDFKELLALLARPSALILPFVETRVFLRLNSPILSVSLNPPAKSVQLTVQGPWDLLTAACRFRWMMQLKSLLSDGFATGTKRLGKTQFAGEN